MMAHRRKPKNEELLLINLSRLIFDEAAQTEKENLLSKVQDWERFTKLANSHGVAALVYNNLNQSGRIPDSVLLFLKNAYLKSLSRNTVLMNQLEEILRVTTHLELKIVLLKGMALELMVYGNAGLRQMSDIDVLTLKKDAVKAQKALIRSGLRPLSPKSVFHKPITSHIGKHLPTLFRNGFAIEIHHDLFGAGKSELTGKFYDTAVETKAGERKMYVPAPWFFFLYLVRHLNKHEEQNESQLRLYTDLVVLIGKYGDEIFCPELFEYSGKAGLNKILATRLNILKEFWRISFPENVEGFIGRWNDPAFTEKFIFFLGSPKGNPLPGRSGSYREVLRDIPGIHRKVLYFIGDLFPTIGFMKKRYGCHSAWKAMLYYPHRLGKFAWLFRK